MSKSRKKKSEHPQQPVARRAAWPFVLLLGIVIIGAAVFFFLKKTETPAPTAKTTVPAFVPTERWLQRAYLIDKLFHQVYTAGWEGAYGAIGDAYLFAATNDSTLLRFHTRQHNLTKLYNGYWVDDRAWAIIAELKWWEITGRVNTPLVMDAAQRYNEARKEGRLSNHEGSWAWYNWPPNAAVKEKIFTNSNMNQMATAACMLFEATQSKHYLDDALLVWNGDRRFPGAEKKLYKGNGIWKGNEGLAAFGHELPWHGAGYCSIGAALYRATGDEKYKKIAVATAKHLMDPATGWVDPEDFYQINMDGNGAFVNYLLDAYMIAPDELSDLPGKVEKMLEHVWTNHHGSSTVTLHRESDHGIRNGWNPHGGEDGYKVGEIGTVHAQGEAMRAFGVFAYVFNFKK